jgi:predicted protein tyrosine phosphatase
MQRSAAPEFILLSRDRAERYEAREGDICISIRDPGAPEVALSPNFAAVLCLQFDDVAAAAPGVVAFAPSDATRIVDFIAQWSGADRVVVHCTGGASRSPGVALGICDLYGWPTAPIEKLKPFWNTQVRGVLADCRR